MRQKKGSPKQESGDVLWSMLSDQLTLADVRELQGYLNGESGFYDMGYGRVTIEPYDGDGGNSRMFRVRHLDLGQQVLSRATLHSILHDLAHDKVKSEK